MPIGKVDQLKPGVSSAKNRLARGCSVCLITWSVGRKSLKIAFANSIRRFFRQRAKGRFSSNFNLRGWRLGENGLYDRLGLLEVMNERISEEVTQLIEGQ